MTKTDCILGVKMWPFAFYGGNFPFKNETHRTRLPRPPTPNVYPSGRWIFGRLWKPNNGRVQPNSRIISTHIKYKYLLAMPASCPWAVRTRITFGCLRRFWILSPRFLLRSQGCLNRLFNSTRMHNAHLLPRWRCRDYKKYWPVLSQVNWLCDAHLLFSLFISSEYFWFHLWTSIDASLDPSSLKMS